MWYVYFDVYLNSYEVIKSSVHSLEFIRGPFNTKKQAQGIASKLNDKNGKDNN